MNTVASKSHVKLYQDYQNWLKQKEIELAQISERVQEKISVQDEREAIIRRLRQDLAHEQAQRFNLDKARESLKKELSQEQRLTERLKADVLGYRVMAKEEQKKRLFIEVESGLLKERIEMLEMQISSISGKNL